MKPFSLFLPLNLKHATFDILTGLAGKEAGLKKSYISGDCLKPGIGLLGGAENSGPCNLIASSKISGSG
jgi:hypothetical protein